MYKTFEIVQREDIIIIIIIIVITLFTHGTISQ